MVGICNSGIRFVVGDSDPAFELLRGYVEGETQNATIRTCAILG